MNYNPYAPPQAPPPAAPGIAPAGAAQPWEIGEVLGVAWEAFKRNWAVLVFGYLATTVLGVLPYFAISMPMLLASPDYSKNPGAIFGLLAPGYGATILLINFFYVGLVKIFVMAARGGEPSFSLLFSGGPRFLPSLGVFLLVLLGTYFGMVFLIVPGVILGCGWILSYFYVVDAEMGVIDSLKASWQATAGQKGRIFLFGLVAFALLLASELTCCGLFVMTPVIGVAWAVICLRLSGRGGPPPASFGA